MNSRRCQLSDHFRAKTQNFVEIFGLKSSSNFKK
jgi:hypothetical protein